MTTEPSLNLEPIRLLLSDVDGILTNGALTFDNNGVESKTFHVRDGMAIKLCQKSGTTFGVITARSSQIVENRMKELGVDIIHQASKDKIASANQILEHLNLSFQNVAYIGDDLTDMALMETVGLAASVSDGAPEVKKCAQLVTKAGGGQGAIRELIEAILKSQNRWQEMLQAYSLG